MQNFNIILQVYVIKLKVQKKNSQIESIKTSQ